MQGCKWHYTKFSENAGVQGQRPCGAQGGKAPSEKLNFHTSTA